MTRLMKTLFLVFALSLGAFGQVLGNQVDNGPVLPATCNVASGQIFFLTTGTIGLYQCLVANTWSQVAISAKQTIVPKSASYAVLSSDFNNLSFFPVNCATTCDLTLPTTAPTTGTFITIQNRGTLNSIFAVSSTATLYTDTGGGAPNVGLIGPGQSAVFSSDGTSYYMTPGKFGSSVSSRRWAQINAAGSIVTNTANGLGSQVSNAISNTNATAIESFFTSYITSNVNGNAAYMYDNTLIYFIASNTQNMKWSTRFGMDDGAAGVTTMRGWATVLSNGNFATFLTLDNPGGGGFSGYGFRCSSTVPDANWQAAVFDGAATQVVSTGITCSTANHIFTIQEHGGNTAYYYVDRAMKACIGPDTGCTAATHFPAATATADLVGVATTSAATRNAHAFWLMGEEDH